MIDKEPKKGDSHVYKRVLSTIDGINTIIVLLCMFVLRNEVSTIWLLVTALSVYMTTISTLGLIPNYEKTRLFFIELEAINSVCFFIPACVNKLSILYQKTLVDSYAPLLNLITFLAYLIFIIYQRIRISNKKVMYSVFFGVYCVSVIFSFLPNDCKQLILDIVFKNPGIYAGIVDGNIFFPAIKEAMLAFIILDVAIESNKEDR